MRIDVVPLRKVPTSVAILSYESHAPVTPGQLVRVPFRGRPLLGVVWNDHSSYTGTTQTILELLPNFGLNAIQREILDRLQTTHGLSVASLLEQHFPAARRLQSFNSPQVAGPTPEQSATMHWYHDRSAMRQTTIELIRQAPVAQPIVILAPTLQHAAEWQALLPDSFSLTSASRATERNRAFQGIADGTIRIIIGTAEVLFLPYPKWPLWIIDDEEHQSHKQTQAPYLDARRALDYVPGVQHWFSPAPTLRRWHRFRPTAPAETTKRLIGRLDQGTNAPWMSWETEAAIRELPEDAKVLWLLPRKNFAQRYGCRTCGWSVVCHSCGSAIRWHVVGQQATCGFCEQQQTLPQQCQQCRASELQAMGLDTEALRASLQKLFPSRTRSMILRAYFQPVSEQVEMIVHVSGDALLQLPDIAAEDRSYQLLQAIASRFPSATQVVQTFDPQFRLWADWSMRQDESWYRTLWQERVDLHLPPAQAGWLARYRGPQPEFALREKRQQLLDQYGEAIRVTALPIRQRRASEIAEYRLMVTSRDGSSPSTKMSWKEQFPHPWAIDMAPDSWLV